jgi:stage II sporulation protein D
VRKGAKRTAARRATLVALAFTATVAATTALSCLAGRSRPDFAIPRDLPGAPLVRVALFTDAPRATIEVRGPYRIYASLDPAAPPQFEGPSLPPTELAAQGPDALVFARYLFRPGLVRVAADGAGTLVVNGTAYRGDLVCRAVPSRAVGAAGGVLAINRVNLEEYVAGVVGSEMPLAFPDAALRAQAIASRTYALWRLKTRDPGAAYDVTDDTDSQVYRGLANETAKAREVTTATLGVILTHAGLIFPAYFHSTCGGRTIPASFELGDRAIEPLAGVPCGFCDDSKYANWEALVAKADLAAKLRKEGLPGVARVDAVEVMDVGPAGHVALVRVVYQGGELRIKGSRFRMIVGPSVLRATLFTIEDRGDKLLFRGRGWGHAVGLCQIGARGMAQRGYDTTAILGRYYPGAELVRIYAAATAGAATAAR